MNIKKTKRLFYFITIFALTGLAGAKIESRSYFHRNGCEIQSTDTPFAFHSGDIIFQTSLSRQSKAIQIATKSKFSHCGIVYKINNDFFVFEAIQPVVLTPLQKFIQRGENGKYVVKRHKNEAAVFTPEVLTKMKLMADSFNGKNYDFTFEWSDEKLYCSELVWKLYKRAANVEVGELEKLKTFDLSDPLVKRILKQRYGDKVPMNELVISPESIFKSDQLETVYSKN